MNRHHVWHDQVESYSYILEFFDILDIYLASSDTDPDKPYRTGFSFEELRKMIQKSISTRVVVILDCWNKYVRRNYWNKYCGSGIRYTTIMNPHLLITDDKNQVV